MASNSLTITDNRTGKTYDVPITNGAIRAMDLRQIRTGPDDFGLLSYDPAFMNTASTTSRITEIDGDRGILRYRGYPIEELAERSSYLEVAYLLLHGELPTLRQMDEWIYQITHHTWIHENIKKFMDGFHYDAHPMGMLVSTVGALSTFYPEARDDDAEGRKLQVIRLIAKMPTLAAFAFRHSLGMPYAYPDNGLSYVGNFLNMLFKTTEVKYEPNQTIERALEVLFILHADHEQNCSTNAVRSVGSSRVDPYSAVAGGVAALYGPLHGGANEEVLRMLRSVGSKERIPEFIKQVKEGKAKLMGFGHRVYKNYDPRAKILKKMAYEVFEVTGANPLIEIAQDHLHADCCYEVQANWDLWTYDVSTGRWKKGAERLELICNGLELSSGSGPIARLLGGGTGDPFPANSVLRVLVRRRHPRTGEPALRQIIRLRSRCRLD